jgi:hypothetical protein
MSGLVFQLGVHGVSQRQVEAIDGVAVSAAKQLARAPFAFLVLACA